MPAASADVLQAYASTYTPVIIGVLIGIVFMASTLFAANLLAPRVRSRGKDTTYECGMVPIGQGWTQMNVRYYLYAILFLIFEIEAVFLFPWAVIFRKLGPVAFWEMMLFLAMLLFGLAYAWRKGVLQWE
jgi:NADH-quinone oxidoreductase subunit A